MFLTDFKCLHDFFYARWLSCPPPPSHFSDNASLTWPLSSSSKSNPPLPSRELVTIKGAVVRALASQECHPGSSSGVDAMCGWVFFGSLGLLFVPLGFSPGTPVFPPLKIQKQKKLAKNGRRRTTMCGCRLPLNRYLMVIVFYLSFIIKPSEKFSNLMIIIIIHVNDQITATLSLLWYFVARESTSVMRQEQMMGGLISSIDVNCRICSCEFFLWFSSLRRKKTTAINSFHLRGPRSPLCYFFFCRCQHKKKFCLY